MKKTVIRLAVVVLLLSFLPSQVVQACSGFIIGKGLTTDGSVLFGRTEDYPYPPTNGAHNKNYIVNPARDYADGDVLVDETFGFTAPHLAHEYKYTSTPDAARGDGSNGIYGAHGFNEHGVSMTATVTAIPNNKVLKVDPLVTSGGLGEPILIDYVLPRVQTAREGVELIAKTIDEKGSAEGNVIILADKNELWYMEVLSGHQYVAIKFPEDKYAIFANTYYLGHVDLTDTANVIASKDVEKVAKEANNYVEIDGQFHIAKSYGPSNYAEADRSRVYAGITLLDPQTSVTYEDSVYDLMRSPTDPNRRYSLQDVFALQRNRFEHLPQFLPDDLAGKVKQGDDGSNDQPTDATYKYALGNENVIDAHVYQIKDSLPSAFGGVVWLGLGQTRNTPYVPFYGIVTDTYEAFKNRSASYDTNSWYWTVQNIDKMASQHPDVFGRTILEKWQALEEEWIAHQANLDSQYAGLTEEAAIGLADPITNDTLARSEQIFQQLKAVEAEMAAKLKEIDDNKKNPVTKLTDEATGISIANPNLAGLEMTVLRLDSNSVQALAGQSYDAYDIRLAKISNKEAVTQLEATTVTIPVKATAQVDKVVYVNEAGEVQSLKFTSDAEKKIISFVTSHFSIYAVVYKEAQTTTTTSASTSTTTGATTGAGTTTTSAVTKPTTSSSSASTKTSSSTTTSNKKKGTLPSTGEQISMVLIGVGIVGLIAALFILKSKKKQ